MVGPADGLLSGATWGVVAILLPTAGQLPSASLPATSVAVAAIFDAAAAVFLLTRAGIADVVKVLASRRALAIGLCSLLGGPLFMGGYVAAVLLAGPADALTATATYPGSARSSPGRCCGNGSTGSGGSAWSPPPRVPR